MALPLNSIAGNRSTMFSFFLMGGLFGFLKEDKLLKRMNRYDNCGKYVGYARKTPLFKNRYDIYDKSGKRTGYIRKNDFLDRWEYFRAK
jgi:hypothetical protein